MRVLGDPFSVESVVVLVAKGKKERKIERDRYEFMALDVK